MSHAPRPCSFSGCPNVTHARYCRAHAYVAEAARAEYETRRLGSNARGYTSRWRKYSKKYLAAHPLCNDVFRRHPDTVTASFAVDHITPHKGDHKLFWDPKNHQPLCQSCHGYKSAIEAGGRAAPRGEGGGVPLAPVPPIAQLNADGGVQHIRRTHAA